MYIAFLDEFGHIGPYVSRTDPKFNHSPVFGLAGYLIPHQHVRSFATHFYQEKNRLLAAEVKASGGHPATWEKKGSELLTTKNISKYPEIKRSVYRMMSKIDRCGGKVFYYGRQKYQAPADSHPSGLYTTCLTNTIRQIDRFCSHRGEHFQIILDQHADRLKLLEAAAKTMFGSAPTACLIEPPFQVESHLYQTIQAADWLAALTGRIMAHRVAPSEFGDWEWAEKYFGTRLDAASTHSTLWKPRSSPVQGKLALKAPATPHAKTTGATVAPAQAAPNVRYFPKKG